MRHTKRCPALAAVGLALALATPGAAANEPAPEQLEPITVIAPVAPLDRSLYLLRIMVEQSTPCLGCDAVLLERPRPALNLLSYLLMPAPPPEVDEATRLGREIKLRDSPDLDYLRR